MKENKKKGVMKELKLKSVSLIVVSVFLGVLMVGYNFYNMLTSVNALFSIPMSYMIDKIFPPAPVMRSGDFEYGCVTSSDNRRLSFSGDYIGITTIYGGSKEVLIIPETIEGKPVVLIGTTTLIGPWPAIRDGSIFQKIYLPSTLEVIRNGEDCEIGKIFLIKTNAKFVENMIHYYTFQFEDGGFYLEESLYQELDKQYEFSELRDMSGRMHHFHVANTTYLVDGAAYWIDDYSIGERITFPTAPVKEGHVFDGWYKDEELLYKWDAETDTFGMEGNEKLKLYAKFVEESCC